MPKKNNRLNARTLNLGEFLKLDCKSEQDSTISGKKVINWYERTNDDNHDGNVPDKISQIILPTAPKKSFNITIDDMNVPINPPFKLIVSNLPFKSVNANMLRLHFKGAKEIKVDNKGFAYVEFYNRTDLIETLKMTNVNIGGRIVRFEVIKDLSTNWEFAKPTNINKTKNIDETNWRNKSNLINQIESKSCSSRYTIRDIPHKERPILQLKSRSESLNDNESVNKSNIKQERQKLNLVPRTKPIEDKFCYKSRKSSIFGKAKPVDTASRQQSIEKLLLEKKEGKFLNTKNYINQDESNDDLRELNNDIIYEQS